MAKYNYDRYSIKKIWASSDTRSSNKAIESIFPGNSFPSGYEGYNKVEFEENTGKFKLSGSYVYVKDKWDLPIYKEPYNNTYIQIEYDSDGDYGYLYERKYERKYTSEKGSYLNTISAEEGTYPNDGIKDGYWYVRKGLSNKAPTISDTNRPLGDYNKSFIIKNTVSDED